MLNNDNHFNFGRLPSFLYAGNSSFGPAAGSLDHASRVAGEIEMAGRVHPRVRLAARD